MFENQYDVAHAIHEYIVTLPSPIRHLVLRPLDYQKPAETSWWLVPNLRQFVYPYSKFFFHQLPNQTEACFIGFSFERGVGGQLKGLVDDALILQSNWYWRRFINDLMAGTLRAPLEAIYKWHPDHPLLSIELYNFDHLHLRLLETRSPDDILVFAIDKDASSLRTVHPGVKQLEALNYVTRLYDLALTMEMSPEFAWYFLRLTFGVQIKFTDMSGPETISHLWHHVLAPWMPLIG